jgi:hypothetical protein
MENKKNEIIQFLKNIVLDNFDTKLNFYKKYNQSFNLLTDEEIEILHSIMYNTICMGSGGSGWDTADQGEGKGTNFLQSRNCNGCKKMDTDGKYKYKKVMFFLDECPHCGSKDLLSYPKDARWGISAKSHIKYIDKLKEYRCTLVEPKEYEPECRTFRIRSWTIDPKNEYLSTYAQKQYESPKSNTINFQPLGRDFYRSSPCLHLDVIVNTNDKNINVDFFDINNKKPEQIPEKYLNKSLEEIMENKTFGKERGYVDRD